MAGLVSTKKTGHHKTYITAMGLPILCMVMCHALKQNKWAFYSMTGLVSTIKTVTKRQTNQF